MSAKIGLYCHTSRLGGAEIAAIGLAKALSATLLVRGKGEMLERAVEAGLQPRQLQEVPDTRPRGLMSWLWLIVSIIQVQLEMVQEVRRNELSVVVSNSVQGCLHLILVRALRLAPVVVYVRDLGKGGNRASAEVCMLRLIVRWTATGVIYNSSTTRDSWNIDRPSFVCGSSVDSRFWRSSWRGGNGADVLVVGRLCRWKGQRQVILALNDLAKRGVHTRLTIVGDRLFDENDCRLPKAEFELRCVGFSDPLRYLERADVMVHASLTPEPFGQVLVQAAAVGVPIVCARDGGHAEWLTDGVTCLMATPTDTRALADAIHATLRDRDAARVRAERARSLSIRFCDARAYVGLQGWIERLSARVPISKGVATGRFS